MKNITLIPIACLFVLACQEQKEKKIEFRLPDTELLDSLKSDSDALYMEIPEKSLVLYLENPFDWSKHSDKIGCLIIRDTRKQSEDSVLFCGNDYPICLLKGQADSTVTIITEGGSGGYCWLTTINLDKKEETLCKSIETNFFHFEGYTSHGYKCSGLIRTYNERYGVEYEAEIDFKGNTLYFKEQP